MGLFEILFERRNPGNIGNFQKNNKPIRHVSIPILILKLIVSMSVVYELFYMTVLHSFNLINSIVFTLFLLIYCLISYKVIPQPDTSNVGLLGGLIDHPFRYSDDLNRLLILCSILLYPGRFIATTVIETILLFKRRGK
jgi:hypothetical protein